tara:strand:- start:49 stop:504 length:456 start_codon:yes stop_codon:yes gene_type:complete
VNKLRKGVGVLIINNSKKIFIGERLDNPGAWQMPQGGVDKKEKYIEAAKRELFEETGITSVSYLSESKTLYKYFFPEKLKKLLWNGKYIGQEQKWFIFKFTGDLSEINLNISKKPEFKKWKWCQPNEITEHIIDFKKNLYKSILNEFKEYL